MAAVNVIVSYDGTANEDDAIALGRLFADTGAAVALAYVRHIPEQDPQVGAQADAVLERGAELLGTREVARHIVNDRSTPEGLRVLAEQVGADVIVFCSDSHTAQGHIAIGNSAQRLLDGGAIAIAIAPAGLARRAEQRMQRIVAVGEVGGNGARATAEALAGSIGATVVPVADASADLLVIDSRPEAESGRVWLSSSAAHLIEIATCPVLVVPRGVSIPFGKSPALIA
jgi:nucleotide-binding universal stress UspA family protein